MNTDIEKILTTDVDNLYLIFGSENYYIDKLVKGIIDKVFDNQNEMRDYNLDILTGDDIYNRYLASLQTLPFMADKRVVLFKNCDLFKPKQTKKDEEIVEFLERYLSKEFLDNDTTVIIIVEGEKVDKRKKLFKAISNNGKTVEFQKVNAYEIKKIINKFVSDNNKKMSSHLVDYMANNLPNDLYLVENELNKLLAYVGEKPSIQQEDLVICSFADNDNIFKLIDGIAFKNLTSSLNTLKIMLHNGEPAMIIMYMIIKQLRNISKAISLRHKGYTTKQLGDLIGVSKPYAQTQLLKQCDNFSRTTIEKSLELAAEYELKIKTGVLGYENGLELLITKLHYL